MKKLSLLLTAAAMLLGLQSCIQDEPLNAECDILGVDSVWLNNYRESIVGLPNVSNNAVSVTLKKGTDRTALAPSFYLTEGATITMQQDGTEVQANGVVRDFSTPQTYTVHSQDGNWQKDYSVSFGYPQPIGLMSFEYYDLDTNTKRYNVWYEVDREDVLNPRRDYWATGNPGYAFCGIAKSAEQYPTVVEEVGVNGRCVKLTTCGTGSFGKMVGMTIAAGSIFIGTFDSKSAVRKPREATHFGLQLMGGHPQTLEGWYKYTAGDVFTDANQVAKPECRDTADIYAVVYECDPNNFEPLNGDNVLSSDRIVMLARIANPGEPQEWTHFSEPFVLQNGKTFDESRLNSDGYAIAVVATSSRQGAYFEGSVGSTLWIDELRVVWE